MLKRFDFYVFSRLMALFSFFVFVLFGIHWTNWVARVFEGILVGGQNLAAFLEYILYFIPISIYSVIPVAAFAAAVYATHRLAAERELTVFQGTGMGPYRMMRPYLLFALVAAAFSMLLSNELVPQSRMQLAKMQQSFATDFSVRRIRAGQFLFPEDGTAVFVGAISEDALLDVFIHDYRIAGQSKTYTAEEAHLLQEDSAVKLLLEDGQVQFVAGEEQKLTRIKFSQLVLDISNVPEELTAIAPDIRGSTSRQLLKLILDTGGPPGQRPQEPIAELNERVSGPVYTCVFALAGAAFLIAGSCLRVRTAWSVLSSVAFVAAVYYAWRHANSLASSSADGWLLIYIPAAVSLALTVVALARARGRPTRFLQSMWAEERV